MAKFAKDLSQPDITEEEFEIQKEAAKASMADGRLWIFDLEKDLEEDSSAREPRRGAVKLRKAKPGTGSRVKAVRPSTALSEPPEGNLWAGGLVVSAKGPIRRVRWLWKDRVPLGAITVLAGDAEVGKTTLLAYLSAKVSKGKLDGELRGTACKVLVVNTEDMKNTTVRPRLLAAGADMERIGFFSKDEEGVVLSSCIPTMEEILKSNP